MLPWLRGSWLSGWFLETLEERRLIEGVCCYLWKESTLISLDLRLSLSCAHDGQRFIWEIRGVCGSDGGIYWHEMAELALSFSLVAWYYRGHLCDVGVCV